MVIPPASPPEGDWLDARPDSAWAVLSTAEKNERILFAAGRVFARDGLDAAMPAVAAEAGAGVGSLYRQFPSKQDLLAALVIRRLLQTQAAAAEAAGLPGDHWQAMKDMLLATVSRHAADDFLGEAWNQVEGHHDVKVAAEATQQAFARLIDMARTEGGVRADATAFDVRLLFVATRAARAVQPDAWERVLELLLDGLSAHRA